MADYIDTIIDIFKWWGNNLSTNLGNTFRDMTTERYIRMIAVVGAYLLLRPYIMKLGAKVQEKEHEKQMATAEAEAEGAAKGKAKISPNALRGGKVEEEEDSDEEEDTETTGANWGKKARKRQRNFVKKVLNAEEQRLKEIEDALDDDIKELLED
ncbi:protein trafficking Pga2 [Xylogone sp. PMI_703]|nr:protein trafficking Pga2 [Xylogone sp. PMI_703]